MAVYKILFKKSVHKDFNAIPQKDLKKSLIELNCLRKTLALRDVKN
jgi:hypothetical protein